MEYLDDLTLIIKFGTFIIVIYALLILIMLYAAQKWAYKCYKEIMKLNTNLISDQQNEVINRLDQILDELKKKQVSP